MTDAFKERLDNVLAPELAVVTDIAVAATRLGTDGGPDGRRLDDVHPAPPHLHGPSTETRRRHRPVYDPFTARRRQTPEWLITYTARVVTGDVVAAAAAAWLTISLTGAVSNRGLGLAAVGALSWPLLLAALGSYAERLNGTGSDEYRRVLIGGLIATCVAGYASQVAELYELEHLLLVGVPLATGFTLLNRALARWRLHAARRRGFMVKHVVLVGRNVAVLDLATRLRRDPAAGLSVVGACVPDPTTQELDRLGIPVLGSLSEVVRVVDEVGADAVVVASASETAGQYLRDLSWRLEGTNIDVLVGPGLLEVSPNRLQVRPTSSVPLIQVKEPEFRGHRRWNKDITERVIAGLLLLLIAPLFLLIVVAIRATSPGRAFYQHRRIGKRGRPFCMLKFRSMVVDADRQIEALRPANEGNAVQFKLRRDPRVTPVGRFLRKYSLDELPQLINVLKGEMSFVGPRPHVAEEIEHYGPDMHRRLLVKPGITGLWQVSGRSDLSWEDAVELDVRYVDNWSFGLDLAIVLRTVRAVLRKTGAY